MISARDSLVENEHTALALVDQQIFRLGNRFFVFKTHDPGQEKWKCYEAEGRERARDERVQLDSIVWILIKVKNSTRGTKSNTHFQQKVIPPFVRFVVPVQEQRYVFGRPLRACISCPTSLVILPIAWEPAAVTPIDDRQDAGTTPFRGGGYHDVAPVEVSMRKNHGCIVAEKSTIRMRRVIRIVPVGIGKLHERIVESLHARKRPHRPFGGIGKHDVKQTSTSDVTYKAS